MPLDPIPLVADENQWGDMRFSGWYYQSLPSFGGLRGLSGGIERSGGHTTLNEAYSGSLDPSNYFSVLNLSFLGKVIQRMITEEFQSFLEDTDIHSSLASITALGQRWHWLLL